MSCLEPRSRALCAPVNLFLNLTSRCNLECVYCSSTAYYGGRHAEVAELTLDDYRRLAARFDELGVFRIIYTGGEPFVREDFLDIVGLLRPDRRGVTVNTNGTFVDADAARRLKALGVRLCAVSLDGADDETNARTRGKGTLARAVAAIGALAAAGVPVAISCTVTRHNFRRLRPVAVLGREYGADISFTSVTALGRAAPGFAELALDAGDRRWLAGELLDMKAGVWEHVGGDLTSFAFDLLPPPAGGGATLLPCGAAKEACAITADGWMLPCNKMPAFRGGNVKSEDIKAVWNSAPLREVRALDGQPVRMIRECADCRHIPNCSGGCRAEAYLATGSLYGRTPSCYAYSKAGGEKD